MEDLTTSCERESGRGGGGEEFVTQQLNRVIGQVCTYHQTVKKAYCRHGFDGAAILTTVSMLRSPMTIGFSLLVPIRHDCVPLTLHCRK